MAKGDSSDILMMFVLDGKPIPGGSQTVLASGAGITLPKLLTGFKNKAMFELDSFNFSVGVEESEEAGGAAGGKSGAGKLPPGHQVVGPDGKPVRKSSAGKYKSFRAGIPHAKYPVTVQPVSITRGIDSASTALLDYCIRSVSFDSCSLVKRKAVGGPLSGEPYLRLDFTGVLITEIGWSNDEPVKETLKFISRAVTVSYRPQLSDNTLGAVKQGFWSMNPWEKEAMY